MSGGDWGWMAFMMLSWVAILVLLVWAVARLSRAIESRHDAIGSDRSAERRESPREVLDRRYAAGEIDAATYSEMRTRLEGGGLDST
jgi:putative membrane protein